MWITELTTKTITADSKTGSQSALNGVIRTSSRSVGVPVGQGPRRSLARRRRAITAAGADGLIRAGAGGLEPPTSRLTGGALGSLGPTLRRHLVDGQRGLPGFPLPLTAPSRPPSPPSPPP